MSNLTKLRELESHLVDPDLAIRIVEEIPDGIVLVDMAALIRYINRQAEIMFGYHRTELFEQPIETLILEAVRSSAGLAVRSAVRSLRRWSAGGIEQLPCYLWVHDQRSSSID